MTFDHTLQALLRSYETEGGINHLDGSNLPSEASINLLAAEVMHLLFPGFFEPEPLTREAVPALTRQRLENLHTHLRAELEKALRFARANDPAAAVNSAPPAARATEIADAVLARLPELRRVVQTDVQAAYAGDPAARSTEEIILAYPCVLVISLQRIAHELHKLGVPHIPRMLTEYAHERTGADIHPGARIGTHFFIDHCTGVVVGETSRIGDRVKLYQGVTLGAKSFELDEHGNPVKGVKRHPDIEDGVTIYPGATILGGRTVIGRDSIIGSNVWLMKSIPPNSIVYYKGDITSVVRQNHDPRAASEAKPVEETLDWII